MGWEDPLEDKMATHSQDSCLENFMDREEPGRLQSMELQRVRHNQMCNPILLALSFYAIVPYFLADHSPL